jgi:hypothetical protein
MQDRRSSRLLIRSQFPLRADVLRLGGSAIHRWVNAVSRAEPIRLEIVVVIGPKLRTLGIFDNDISSPRDMAFTESLFTRKC